MKKLGFLALLVSSLAAQGQVIGLKSLDTNSFEIVGNLVRVRGMNNASNITYIFYSTNVFATNIYAITQVVSNIVSANINGTVDTFASFGPDGSSLRNGVINYDRSNQVVNINVPGNTNGTIGSSGNLYLTPAAGVVSTPSLISLTNTINGAVNVVAYGTVGDGVTDDTAAIQSAINAVQPTGGSVFLPRGTYAVAQTLSLLGTNITFYGDGATLKSTSPVTNAVMLSVEGQQIRVSDLIFDFNYRNARGLFIGNYPSGTTRSVTIDHCELSHCTNSAWAWGAITVAAYTASSNNVDGVTIYDCWIHHNTNASGVSVYADNGLFVKNVRVLHNRFYGNVGKDIVFDQNCTEYLIDGNHCEFNDGGIHLENDGIGQVLNNVITNCNANQSIIGVPGHAVAVFLAHDVTLAHNIISDIPTNRYGFYVNNNSQNIKLIANEVTGGQYGAVIDSSANITASGNTFLSPGRNGIYVHSTTHSTITGNIVGDPNVGADTNSIGNGAGIYLDSSLFNDVNGNLCYDDRFGSYLMDYGIVDRFGGVGNMIVNNISRNAITNAVYRENAFPGFNWDGVSAGDLGATNAPVISIYASGGHGNGHLAYGFSGYPGTGIDLFGADDMDFWTAGSPRIRVNSTGLLPNSRYALGTSGNPWGDSVVHSLTSDGSIVLTNNEVVYWYDSSASLRSMLSLDGANVFHVSKSGTPAHVDGILSPQAGIDFVHPNNMTSGSLALVDGSGNLVNIPPVANTTLQSDGATWFSTTGINQTNTWTATLTNWTMVVTRGLITSLTHSP